MTNCIKFLFTFIVIAAVSFCANASGSKGLLSNETAVAAVSGDDNLGVVNSNGLLEKLNKAQKEIDRLRKELEMIKTTVPSSNVPRNENEEINTLRKQVENLTAENEELKSKLDKANNQIRNLEGIKHDLEERLKDVLLHIKNR